MKNYIDQLLADIEEKLNEKAPHELHQSPEDFTEMLQEAEDHLMNEMGAVVSEFSAIGVDQLPAVELLSAEEIEVLLDRLTELLEHYHLYLDFPEEVPATDKYRKLREEWETYKAPWTEGNYHHDFCSYDPDDCPFPGYCDICNDDSPAQSEHGAVFPQTPGEYMKRLMSIGNGKFISGVHNYCDRWCERCQLSSVCAVFAMEATLHMEEIEDGRSWLDEIMQKMQDVEQIIADAMNGLDITAEDLSKNEGFKILDREEMMFNQEARGTMTIAEHYTRSVHEWLDKEGYKRVEEAVFEQDVFDTLLWYQTIIATKMYRSLMTDMEEFNEDPVQNDRNGSAKVCIHSIRESMYAWAWIILNIEEFKEAALYHSILLTEMLSSMEERFPRAGEFVRPGFDQKEHEWEFVRGV